ISPPSVIEYLQKYWMNDTKLWSAVYRQERSIAKLSDTNMLLEAYHHVLKSNHLEGKRNRRLDSLIYTLNEITIPYYKSKHTRRELGLEGDDLEEKKRQDITK
ncbi:uncharacterized protein FOMMEDRAFT_40357, partial [Fomitiporia mediterranea MF3/22]|uniref:uncharacterized protein n=1 Tax=Fomitiporia mediterranea (strain MF3/22) TaxID=694068 RepID=UPI0004409022